jgi:acetolactate synthase-1/2/3 large subunit
VPTHLIGSDAFQECDTVGITRPCTKHNWLVKDVNDLPRMHARGLYVATTAAPARWWSIFRRTCSSPRHLHAARRRRGKTYQPRVKGDREDPQSAVRCWPAPSGR